MEDNFKDFNVRAVRVCLDMDLPASTMLEAAGRAIEENDENAPSGTITGRRRIGIRTEVFGAALTGKKWKNGRVLRVSHLNGEQIFHQKVEYLAKTWEHYANIHLEFVDTEEAEIRILYAADNMSWSYIGTDALSIDPDRETMHLGWLTPTTPDDEFRRVVVHEFGHALGMIHEHQNPTVSIKWNKPAVYRYYKETQNWDKVTVDSNLFSHYSEHETQFSAYDQHSIMHYPIPAEFTLDGMSVDWNTELSETDKQFIGEVYPKETRIMGENAPLFAPRKLVAASHIQKSFGI